MVFGKLKGPVRKLKEPFGKLRVFFRKLKRSFGSVDPRFTIWKGALAL